MIDWVRKLLSKKPYVTGKSTVAKIASGCSGSHTAQDPSKSPQYKSQGDLYFAQGKFTEAAACYADAIACDPAYAEAYKSWSNVCREQNRLEDAERCLRKAAELKPGLRNVQYNLGSLLLASGRLDEALEAFDKEVRLDPTHYAALAILLHLKQKMCDWRGMSQMIEALRHSLYTPTEAPEQTFSPFAFLVLPGPTPAEQRLCAQKWVHLEYSSKRTVGAVTQFTHKRPRNEKIVLGYLSSDFHDHATARLIAELLELHDRNRFSVVAYSYGPDDGSEMRHRLRKSVDYFIDLRNVSDIDSARKIYADRVDILVDLKGHTQNSRSGILAFRPATHQINYLGYPGTMGADFVDFLIADPFVIPREYEQHYTEKILRLPNSYQPNDRKRPRLPAPPRASCHLPDDALVFCCFNQPYKVTPEVFDIWCRLLNEVTGSVLWLYVNSASAETALKREAITRGISPSRLITAAPMRQEQHLARLQCADLFLDTFPCNAHTTCSDALWMGLPVVTCAGETFPSRVAGSLLSALSISELIANNLEDYFQLALGLATNKERLAVIRNKILSNQETAPLFDTPQLARDIENLYTGIMDERPF